MPGFVQTQELSRECVKFEQLTSLSTATSVPGGGDVIVIQAETQAVRYRCDGVDPTASIGVLINAGECHELDLGAENMHKVKIIEVSASAKANIHVFK